MTEYEVIYWPIDGKEERRLFSSPELAKKWIDNLGSTFAGIVVERHIVLSIVERGMKAPPVEDWEWDS